MSGPAASVPFNATPLVEAVDKAAVREFIRSGRANGTLPASAGIGGIFVTLVVLAMFGGAAFIMVSIFSSVTASMRGGVGAPLFLLPMLLVIAFLAATTFFVIKAIQGSQERWYRLTRFAHANAMSYLASVSAPGLPGMIFNIGSSRSSTDVVRGDKPRFVEFANYTYTTGSGKNKSTHKWGYVAVKLTVPLPNIVLDATSNNSLFGSNLPASFRPDQTLSLEGDFDRYFTLYCPEGYERDALYLFTPDIMARFIDHAAALDVEIVDDWLFLYGQRQFSTLDPATWAWLFSVVGALLDKFAQWERWRDDRLMSDAAQAAPAAMDGHTGVAAASASLPFAAPASALRPPPGVAPPGRRLQRRFPWLFAIFVGGFFLFWLLTQLGFFAGVLGVFR